MRYLLTVILVLALASPAMSICTAPGDAEHADTDNDLNILGGQYYFDIEECSSCAWSYRFFRNSTSGLDPETMTLKIDGTDFERIFPAQSTLGGWYSDNSDKSGRATVTSSPNEVQMLISPDTKTVYFEEIDLSASDYE